MSDQRIKGQEVSIRVVQGGVPVASIDSISVFNDTVALELKETGFLGETVNRFDEILNGFGGDCEFHVTKPEWNELVEAIISRAKRETPDTNFNVVRADYFPNGQSALYTYRDVKFGEIPTNVPSRGDYVKARLQFKCSERPVKIDGIV